MLHHIRDVNFRAVNARFREGLIENSACWTDERPASPVFLIARLLPHHHYSGGCLTFAENGVRCRLPKITSFAARSCSAKVYKGSMGRNQRFGAGSL
jgi:hypothetical protein